MHKAAGLPALKGTHCSAISCLAGAGLGQESGTDKEKSYLEKCNYSDSTQIEGRDSQTQEEWNSCKGTKDFFASNRPHKAKFVMGKWQ